ncbi:tripartite motif-containing protein 16-like [Pholidichthys leucotaenia]
MAQQGHMPESEKLSCSICQDLLKDPVTIQCGHSYCMNCIKTHWDGEEEKGIPSCPECRKTFIPRPDLMINILLAELVKEQMKIGLQAAPTDHCYTGSEDVSCDVCTGRKLKAVKSCLVCFVSYCDQHLHPHYTSPAFKNHKLINPSKRLKNSICSVHNEPMKIFCCTDQQCICYLCSMNQHKLHQTVPTEVERANRQKELETNVQDIEQRIHAREERINVLQKEEEKIKKHSDNAVKVSETAITEMVSFIKERGSELKQQIRSWQITEVSRVKELKRKLRKEISELKRMHQQLKQLSNTEDHNEFINNYSSDSNLSEFAESPSFSICPATYFRDLQTAISEARQQLKAYHTEEWCNISMVMRSEDTLLPQPEPTLRKEFLKCSCQLTLDPETVNKSLYLTNQNRTASNNDFRQSTGVFWTDQQVLSKERLTGRCYWEVERKGTGLSVAVVHGNKTDWDQSVFGSKDNSWALDCNGESYKFRHKNTTTKISGPPSTKIGVYLDARAGILSFYSISDTMTLLHRVQTTFTQPLYAGLWIWSDTSATFNEIT